MRTRAPVHQNALRNLPALNETRWHQNRFFPPGRHIRKLGVQGSKLGVQGSKLGVQGSKSDPGTSVSPDPALMSRLVCKYHHRQIANRPTHHHIRSADFSYVARLSITTFRVRFPTALLRKIVAATRLLHYFPPLGTLVMAKMSGAKSLHLTRSGSMPQSANTSQTPAGARACFQNHSPNLTVLVFVPYPCRS